MVKQKEVTQRTVLFSKFVFSFSVIMWNKLDSVIGCVESYPFHKKLLEFTRFQSSTRT